MTEKITKALSRLNKILPLKENQENSSLQLKKLHQHILRSFVEKGRILNKTEISAFIDDFNLADGSNLADDYDAVFYAGGHGPLWDLAEDNNSIALIEKMYTSGKPVAAVCHAPAVLRHTKAPDGSYLIKGKSITGFSNSEEDAVQLSEIVPFLLENELKEKGANYSKGEDWHPYEVTDGNLITGQNPASSEPVAKVVLAQLNP